VRPIAGFFVFDYADERDLVLKRKKTMRRAENTNARASKVMKIGIEIERRHAILDNTPYMHGESTLLIKI
jgi:hypothetical protein